MEWTALSQHQFQVKDPTILFHHKCLCICERNSEGDRYGVDSTLSNTTFQSRANKCIPS